MESRRSSNVSVCAAASCQHAPVRSLPLQKPCRLYSHSSTDRKCRSTGYDYQNGGSYFDGSHNASFVRCAPAFVCSTAGKLKKKKKRKNRQQHKFISQLSTISQTIESKDGQIGSAPLLRADWVPPSCFLFFFLEGGGVILFSRSQTWD